ncbi:MAG: hypothetical protein WC852_05245 [Candidatus Nanoarchaeia archaeon]|jgi:hypothetical protein
MKRIMFGSDSVVQSDTNIDQFVPPNRGWNFVRILNHPEDSGDYIRDKCGKWLLFVPNKDFIDLFRKLAKLTKELKLTHCFKASGSPSERGEHVFCIYCSDCSNISFVRKIANVLLSNGLLDEYGYRYWDGIKALFFKTDSATDYKSQSMGESLTLFKFTNKNELFVKKFDNMKPRWELIVNDNDSSIIENFEEHLILLEMSEEERAEL